MKAIIQNLKTGKLQVEEVPPPSLQPEGILVRIHRSLISIGTERAVIALANKGPLGKAKDRPDLAQKVLNKAKQEGYWNTYKVVSNLISSPIPLGYSCAGEVIEVGHEATEFKVGDRVACAGLNFANHAEIDYIPRNLAVKIPRGLPYDDAAFVTIGAIAMQGVRLADIQLGDRVVVMGLGLIGQVAAQLARCAGGAVLVADLDTSKGELATSLGAERMVAGSENLAGSVKEFTQGAGADVVLLCASTKSDDLIQKAAEISRLKGTVIVVGDVGLGLERRAFFEKELKLIISRSYGPGRYDPTYEVRGKDYPLPYVRWTEGRNMQSFLELISRKLVSVQSLVTHRYPIGEAEQAYKVVTGETPEPAIAIILEYPDHGYEPAKIVVSQPAHAPVSGEIPVGVIGAGQFAQGVLLPALAQQRGLRMEAFCTSSGIKSKHVATRYGARYCTSNPQEIIQDEHIRAVVIATRHNLHADLTIEALKAGKAVFVEKPLAMTPSSLLDICRVVEALPDSQLFVGYNRRFSPLAVKCKEFFEGRNEPMFLFYRVNAGYFPPDSWVFDPVEGGGRIIGEVCHFIDMVCFLTGALPEKVYAEEVNVSAHRAHNRDSVTITLRMTDGSVGTIHYLANGDSSVSKEYLEVYAEQKTAILDNYCKLYLHARNRRKRHSHFNQIKGHREEAEAFVQAIKNGHSMPIPLETLIAVTQTSFLIHRSLDLGRGVTYISPQEMHESMS